MAASPRDLRISSITARAAVGAFTGVHGAATGASADVNDLLPKIEAA